MSEIQQLSKASRQEQQVPRALDVRTVFACLAISIFSSVWVTLASGSFKPAALVFLLALPWVLLRTGSIITAVLRLPSFFSLDFLIGVAVVSVGVMAWKMIVPVSLWVVMILLVATVVAVPKFIPHHQREPVSALELLAVIVSLLAATGWSQELILPTVVNPDRVVLKPWSDFFLHASVIARGLSTKTLFETGNYEWKGFPAIFYHYASYSLPWCLATASRIPAYAAAVGFWAPFGSFLSALASYSVGRTLWNQTAGLAALIATFLLPDAGLLNIAHPTYGYFWLQHISPGGLYGVAVAGTALMIIVRGAREGHRGWIATGVLTAALTVFFKLQIFLAAVPLLVGFAIVTWPARSRWRWIVLGACIAAGLALLPLANSFYVGPNVQFDFFGSASYWKLLAQMAAGTRAESWYHVFAGGHPFPAYLPQAIALLLVSVLGVFAILGPVVWIAAAWRKEWQFCEGLSVGAIAILLLMTFGLGGNAMADDSYELINRPFVWVYWLVGSLTAGRLVSMLAEKRPRLLTRIIVVAAIALAFVPVYCGAGLQHGKWAGGNVHSGIRVDRGLIDCARYIRRQPPPDALAQDSHLDPSLILGGLAERPAFAARVDIWTRASQGFRNSPYREQLHNLEALQHATTTSDLQRMVRETGIRWYVLHPGDSVGWPAEFRDQPQFESNGYRVYDMQRAFELQGPTSGS